MNNKSKGFKSSEHLRINDGNVKASSISNKLRDKLREAPIQIALDPKNGSSLYHAGYLLYKLEQWEAAASLIILAAYKNRNQRERRSALALASVRNSDPNNIDSIASLKGTFVGKTKSFEKNLSEAIRIFELHSHIVDLCGNSELTTCELIPTINFEDRLNARIKNIDLLEIIYVLLRELPSDLNVKELCRNLHKLVLSRGLLHSSYLDTHDCSEYLIHSAGVLHEACKSLRNNPVIIHWSVPIILANLFVSGQFFKEYMELRDLSIYLLNQKLMLSSYSTDLRLERLLVFKSEFENRSSNFSFKPSGPEEERVLSYSQVINDVESQHNQLSSNILKPKHKFYEYFNGKSCAIVGSAFTNDTYGEEIDTFDVIVRINYRDTLTHKDAQRFGSKVNVSYYNSGDTITFRDEIMSALPQLDWAVFKRREDVSEFQSLTNTRILRRNLLMYKGAPNGVQNALSEIHLCKPSRLKVFNTTFYCSNKNYINGYRANHSLKGKNWIVHDAVSNFAYVLNLWYAGIIEADPECTSILKLGVQGYISEMNHIYSPNLQTSPLSQ